METEFIIYDANCPFCKWYTGLFVKTGLLNPNGRIPYSTAINLPELQFDMVLSRDKIALINPETKEVHYGIDSLLHVLGKRFSWIERIGKLPVIHFLLTCLYSFISYNRKIIAPSRCETACDCAPSQNYFWRFVFIVGIALFLNFAVTHYFTTHLAEYFIGNPKYGDLLYFTGQFFFQFFVFFALKQKNFYDYAGHLAFVSFLGAVFLSMLDIGISGLEFFNFKTELFKPFCYGMVYLFMVYEHARRLKIMGFTAWLSVTWIVYRILIYPLAFDFI